jgi:murein DD-endopeptidase MepM/ murein hydrolase activator NlpD
MAEKRRPMLSFLTLAQVWVDDRLHVLFPFRQIVFRSEGRVKCLNLTSRLQGAFTAVFLAFGAWFAYSSGSVFFHELELAQKDAQIAEVRVAYRSLLGEVADYQKRFSTVVSDLEENHALMLKLAGQNTKLNEGLKSLGDSHKAKTDVEATRVAMKDDLTDVESQMKTLAQRNFSLKDDMSSIESDLQDALSQRNTALLQRTQMRRDIKVLENQLVSMEDKENNTVERLTDQTDTFITSMENLVELTGLDVGDLMAGDTDLAAGQGGPFIEFKADDRPGGRLKSKLQNLDNRLSYSESLQTVLKKMPFTTPVHGYYITSTFGKRRDPVNRRWAWHYGLDFASTPHASIYVTAPGKVVYAGWRGAFGKMVEVDHGAGIKTRYAHMSKLLVKVGQKVQFGDKIGVIGSTGRSTGPHLHYEVLFRDKGLDPMQFIKAGRYVFKE